MNSSQGNLSLAEPGPFSSFIATEIAQGKSDVCVVCGPYGIGKTYVLQHVARVLRSKLPKRSVIVDIRCFPEDTGYEPLVELAKRISVELAPRGLRKAIDAVWQRKVGVMNIGAALGKLVGALLGLPLDAVVDIASALETEATRSSTSDRLSAFPQSRVRELLRLLSELSQRLDAPAMLILDNVANLPEPGIQLLTVILDNLPQNIKVVMALNSEAPGYSTRKDLLALRRVLQRHCQNSIYHMEGKSPEAIQEWKQNESGMQIPIEVAREAFQQSRQGRPGLLAAWIASTSVDPTAVQYGSTALFGVLDEQYSTLGERDKEILALMTVVHPIKITFSLIGDLLSVKPTEIEAARDNMSDLFIAHSPSGEVHLKDDSIASFLKLKLGTGLLDHYARSFFDRSHSASRVTEPVRRRLELQEVTSELRTGGNAEAILSYITRCLSRGALAAAGEALQETQRIVVQQPAPRKLEMQRFQLGADWLGQQGDYRTAIDYLKQAQLLADERGDLARVLSDEAEKRYRLNEYAIATSCLRCARKLAAEAQLWDVVSTAAIRLTAILVDIGKYRSAHRVANVVLAMTNQDEVSPKVRCHALRVSARVLALAPERRTEAITLAGGALTIARETTRSLRDEGNSRYALADAFRHAGRLEESRTMYQSALQIAEDTGNYDLAVYSILGLCNSLRGHEGCRRTAAPVRCADTVDR